MLTGPSTAFGVSFLTAMREFEEETGTADADGLSVADLSSGDCFADYVRSMNEGSLPWQRTHAGSYVRCFWWAIDGEFIGRVSVWPDLTPDVPDANHIGYAVRPSHRRQGHATAMLAAVLPVVFNLGVDPVVLVCTEMILDGELPTSDLAAQVLDRLRTPPGM